MYWKNKSGFHRVGSKFVRQALQQFMVDSSVCCNTTKQVQVVSVERIENEHLWQMYQTRRKVLQKELAAHSLAMRKLSRQCLDLLGRLRMAGFVTPMPWAADTWRA